MTARAAIILCGNNATRLWQKLPYTYERLTPHLVFPANSHSYFEDLLSNISLHFSTRNPLIEGFVQPIRIDDSYGLCLNIGCREDGTADNIKVSFIKKFKSTLTK